VSRKAVLDLFEGAARYLDDLANSAGERVCPQHGVEHLGKSAYRIHMGLALATERGASLEPVRTTALHLARHCQKYPHPEARAYLFFARWPDKWNCSNHLIDSGAACDALGRVLIEAPDLLDAEEREQVVEALSRCAETYLWAASVDKPVAAQCLWGALGMARAARALGREDLADRARAAIDHAYRALRPDGSWSYYPAGGEAGSDDASAFYHSRCVGFALEALELIGEDPREAPHGVNLRRALDFLLAIHRRDGTKCRAWEAKLWYFDGSAEVASCSFDVHALLLGYRAFGDERLLGGAAGSLEHLLAAQSDAGSIDSGALRAFQCSTFWTAHTGLLSSVLPELDALADRATRTEPVSGHFADAGLVRLESSSRTVLVRVRRGSRSPGFGGFGGGGAIVSDSSDRAGERVEPGALSVNRPGEFVHVQSRFRPTLGGGRLKTALQWLRFSRWRWRCEWRAAGASRALALAAQTLAEVFAWCRSDAASHFATHAEAELQDSSVRIRSGLARVDGSPASSARTERRYELSDSELTVTDTLSSDSPLSTVSYRLPAGASEVLLNGEPFSGPLVIAHGVRELALSYELR